MNSTPHLNQVSSASRHPIRIALAEDSLLLREGLVRLFEDAGYQLVASVGDGNSLLKEIAGQEVDIAILDVRMPPTFHSEGIKTAIQLRYARPGIAIMLLSQYVELTYATELLANQAQSVGYLLKNRVASLDELTSTVNRLLAGETVLDPEVVKALMGQKLNPLDSLTPRERESLELMAQGMTNQMICEKMSVSLGAVEKYVSAIFQKLGLENSQAGHRRVMAVLTWLQQ